MSRRSRTTCTSCEQMLLAGVATLLLTATSAAPPTPPPPTRLRASFLPPQDARGVPVAGLELSWEAPVVWRAATVTNFQAQVVERSGAVVWDSGKQTQTHFEPGCVVGATLAFSTPYTWRARLWVDGTASVWSSPAAFITEANPEVWGNAQWVGGANNLRSNFTVPDGVVASAILHATGVGAFTVAVNGIGTTNTILNPGQSVYTSRALYTTDDVTVAVKPGVNPISAQLGNYKWGYLDVWCKLSSVGPDGCRALRFALVVTMANGTALTITSQASQWVARHGPTFYDNLYHGEQYDARLEAPGWDTKPLSALVGAFPAVRMAPMVGAITSQRIPYIRETMRLAPVSTTTLPGSAGNHSIVYDFGQNMAGVTELTVTADAGVTITLRHTEILFPNGSSQNIYYPCTTPTGWNCANQTDSYTTASNATATWSPTFTQHGFRYVEVTASPSMAAVQAISLVARMFNTNATVVGSVALPSVTGVELGTLDVLNRVQHAVVSAQRSQLMSIPTDCPQREKRGWLGDAQLSSNEAMLNFDMQAFYRGWLQSIRDDQLAGCGTNRGRAPCHNPPSQAGSLSNVEPSAYIGGWPGSPVWQVAYVVIARHAYKHYADVALLQDNFDGLLDLMAYFDRFVDPTSGLVEFGNLGDWPQPWAALTPVPAASAFVYVQALGYMADIAGAVGNSSVASHFASLHDTAVTAYHTRFFNASTGGFATNSQTANVMALLLGVPSPQEHPRVVSNLVDPILRNSSHVAMGIVGATYLFDVLAAAGHDDLVVDLLLHDAYPSFGYMVHNNATTTWEAWQGTATYAKNSRNHIMLAGGVGTAAYTHLAGMDTVSNATSSGWRDVVFQAVPAAFAKLSSAAGEVRTRFGRTAVSWANASTHLDLNATLPAGSRATCWLPAVAATDTVTEGGAVVWQGGKFVPGVAGVAAASPATYPNGKPALVLRLDSGEFAFRVEGGR